MDQFNKFSKCSHKPVSFSTIVFTNVFSDEVKLSVCTTAVSNLRLRNPLKVAKHAIVQHSITWG